MQRTEPPKKSVFFGIVFGLLLLGLRSTAGVAPQVMFEDVASRAGVTAHFGLGSSARVKLLEIGWPGGIVQRIENVAADRILRVEESSGHVPLRILQPTRLQSVCLAKFLRPTSEVLAKKVVCAAW